MFRDPEPPEPSSEELEPPSFQFEFEANRPLHLPINPQGSNVLYDNQDQHDAAAEEDVSTPRGSQSIGPKGEKGKGERQPASLSRSSASRTSRAD